MFAENQDNKAPSQAGWLDQFARRYPTGFDVALGVLAMGVTVLLLRQSSSSFVLYQGF